MNKMKRKLATMCTIVTIGLTSISYVPILAKAAPIHETGGDKRDFNKDTNEAKDFVKDAIKKQKTEIGEARAKDIEQYTSSIEDYALKTGEAVKDGDGILERRVENLDKAFDAEKTGIETSITVYKNIDPLILSAFKGKIGQSEEETVKMFEQKKGQIIPIRTYLAAKLSHSSGTDPILAIEIPKGTHAAFTDKLLGAKDTPGVITEKDCGLAIGNISKILDGNKYRIKIEAKLVPSHKMPKDQLWRPKFDRTKGYTETPAGLQYKPAVAGGKREGRIEHVLKHAHPDTTKPQHSVFNVEEPEILKLLDEAWTKKGKAALSNADGDEYEINMGRVIGTNGETKIKIIVEPGTSSVITAYPIK
ncbi:hypothetical protein ER45_029810 (plasmid) [Bacillus mycoides]|nr:hypothetical protein ER45_029810 [Bacillus mycoides]